MVAKPAHTVSEPLIGVGFAFTFIGQVAIQLVGSTYDIMTEPAVIPFTTPLASTVAMAGLLLTHVPPGVALLSTVMAPSHTFIRPVMGDGSGFTVKLCERIQPVAGKVYVMIVMPAAPPVPGVAADKPVATPLDGSMYATPGSPTLQIPPKVALLMFVVSPSHTCG